MNRLKTAFLAILMIGGGTTCSSTNISIRANAEELNFNNNEYKSELATIADKNVNYENLISDSDATLAKVYARFLGIESNYNHDDFNKSVYIPCLPTNTTLQQIQTMGINLPYLHFSDARAYQYDVLFEIESKYYTMDFYVYLAEKQNDTFIPFSTAFYNTYSISLKDEGFSQIGSSLKYSFTTDKTDFYMLIMYRSSDDSIRKDYEDSVGFHNISVKTHNMNPDYGYSKTIYGNELYNSYENSQSTDNPLYVNEFLSVHYEESNDNEVSYLSSYEFIINGDDTSLIDRLKGNYIFHVEFNSYPYGISVGNKYWIYDENLTIHQVYTSVIISTDINFIFNAYYSEIRFDVSNILQNNNLTCLKSVSILPLSDKDRLSPHEIYIQSGFMGSVSSNPGTYYDGYVDGMKNGYDNGYTTGKSDGYSEGNSDGFTQGFNYGYQHGYEDSYDDIYDELSKQLQDDAYDKGYSEGRESAANWWTKFCDFWSNTWNKVTSFFDKIGKKLGLDDE